MASHNVYLEVPFYDAAERTSTKEYLLRTQYDDTDTDTWGDVVTEAGLAITALNVLTMAAIPTYRVSMTHLGGGSPNVAANNQTVAFSRIRDTGGEKSSIEVPAWDDVVFDENNQNVLSDAYDTAIAALALLLRAPETLTDFALSPDYSQSRTHKSRNVIND